MSSASHVVIADEDSRQAGVLSWVLRERGYDVSAVRGDALEELLRVRPTDLVLLSVNGRTSAVDDLLKRVRSDRDTGDVPVIIAGVADPDHAAAVLRNGADDWLPKPLQITDLLARVAALLKGRAELRDVRLSLMRRQEELQRAHYDLATARQLVEILNEVTADLTAAEIYRVLARRVARALEVRHCSVVLTTTGEATGTVVATLDDSSVRDLQVEIDRYPELQTALKTNRAVLVPDVMQNPMFAEAREAWGRESRTPPVRSVLAIPFALDRRRSGVFFLRTERGERALNAEDSDFAEVVIRAAVAAIRRAQALESTREDNRRLEELATTDSLTRLLNRRALLERLSVELDRARRFRQHLSLLMVDIDHFKAINDQHGHLVGDTILRELGIVLAGAVRTVDVVARYGGEEFVVIVPETALEGAAVFGERLRERVAEHHFDLGAVPNFHLTCSVGVATFPSPRVASPEDLFARADEALYRAKSGGRNQVRT
ncbi:MAG TPA: diguanylate cyclase [Gemmatimonadaceae bacterium]|nr:diguanylate cyclase [Gemmatimonadaceae bacterium]